MPNLWNYLKYRTSIQEKADFYLKFSLKIKHFHKPPGPLLSSTMSILTHAAPLSLFFVLLLSSCGNQPEDPDGKPEPSIGDVKKVKEERVDIFSFKGADSLCEEIVETLFDTAGNISLETYYDGGYTRVGGKKFYYASGKLVSTHLLESFIYKETDTLLYDASGVIVKQVKEVTNNHIPIRRLSTQFSRGKPQLKMEEDLLEDKINWKDTFQWSDDLKKLEKTGFDGKGAVVFYSSYVYNDRGDELEYRRYDADKKLVKESFHEYDAKGKTLKYTEQPTGKTLLTEKYSYNDKGKKIRLECFEGGEIPNRTYIYSYNENGDLALVVRMDGDGKVNRKTYYSYEYHPMD